MKSSAALLSLRLDARRPGYWKELLLVRVGPALFFSLFLAAKVLRLGSSLETIAHHRLNVKPLIYMSAFNDLLALVYFGLLVVLFATRPPSIRSKKGVRIVAVAFFGTFSMLATTLLPGVPPRTYLLLVSDLFLAVGLSYSIFSLAYLGRSLSILPEARHLVTSGPYGWSRHPLYLGELSATIGSVITVIALPGLFLGICFLGAQFLRISWEEAVLSESFGAEYSAYRSRVPKYLPNPFHGRTA